MDVTYEFADKIYGGVFEQPAAPTKKPGILVLHGGGGLGEHAINRTRMLAELGYAAYAPDLFGRKVVGLEEADAMTEHFVEDWERLCQQCDAALATLKAQPGVDADRVACVGICFGGQLAMEYARSGVDLRAVIGFHPRLITRQPDRSRDIRGKVLMCLGDRDRFVSLQEREQFLANMTSNGVDCQVHLYSGVDHSFTDPYAEASGIEGLKYDARADRRSWAAMQSLLTEAFNGE